MSKVAEFSGIKEFIFSAPLYAKFKLASDLEDVKRLYSRTKTKIDAHCPYCHRASTFVLHGGHIPAGDPWNNVSERISFDSFSVECARNERHKLFFWFLISRLVIEKIGQHPSLADIANDESGAYRTILSKQDGSEFHRAIGLAAHGVGIGSYVYLRRIFERLISKRFDESKHAESWKIEDFEPLRMDEKIDFLKNHLPTFLVEHKRIYGILSLGVRELEEEECIGFLTS
ncbi:MAG: short-chain dehydrogenase [Bauldia sp.]|nr:MAG: short-chain dehydrogenase [Bauldia sp.]MBZ0227126.1 hypothetical protein [Bauldia sp.]